MDGVGAHLSQGTQEPLGLAEVKVKAGMSPIRTRATLGVVSQA